jgi:polyhydroxyalkanoate synthesis repressor PhaR
VIRLIKRYGSRKLYDTEESRYVSLEELGAWIRQGQELRVIDNATSDDVTAQTLTQVILEEGRKGTSLPPSQILHELIRQGGELVTSGVEQVSERVDRLLQVGADRLAPIRRVREETAALRKRLDELEAALSRIETEPRPASAVRRPRRGKTSRKKKTATAAKRRGSPEGETSRAQKPARSTG